MTTNEEDDEESEEIKQVGSGRAGVVRVTVVMPATMYEAVKSGADENYQLIGEYLRDMIRKRLDEEANLVECGGKDCEAIIDSRLPFCPYCGADNPELEEEEEEE